MLEANTCRTKKGDGADVKNLMMKLKIILVATLLAAMNVGNIAEAQAGPATFVEVMAAAKTFTQVVKAITGLLHGITDLIKFFHSDEIPKALKRNFDAIQKVSVQVQQLAKDIKYYHEQTE